jgi:hypothetical protein
MGTLRKFRWLAPSAIGLAFCSVLPAAGSAGQARAAQEPPQVFGYLENAMILPAGFLLKAKLDTGADHSSVHAKIIERSVKNGEPWVTFDVESVDGREIRLTEPVFRTAFVKRLVGKPHQRPVVMLTICVGKIKRRVEVNLMDRTKLKYNLLIGRSFMSGYMAVNPAKRFTKKPNCGVGESQ